MGSARTWSSRLHRNRDVALEDFAGRALGQLVDEPDPAWVFVARDAFLDEVADGRGVGFGAGHQRDRSTHLLAERVVGDADDSRLADSVSSASSCAIRDQRRNLAVGVPVLSSEEMGVEAVSRRIADHPSTGKLRRVASRSIPSWIAPSTSS